MLGRLFTAISPRPVGHFPYSYPFGTKRPGTPPVMDENLLENYVRQQIEDAADDDVIFDWLCGEPSAEKLALFRLIVALQARHCGNKRIHNCLQTDGVLPEEAWCQFLANHQWLVEVPLMGPEEWHDAARISRGLEPNHQAVMDTLTLLKKHHVELKLVVDINRFNSQLPRSLYAWLTAQGVPLLQLMPRSETNSEGQLSADSITGQTWGFFLTTLFQCWVREDIGRVFIQQFDAALGAWCGLNPLPQINDAAGPPPCQRCQMRWLCQGKKPVAEDINCELCSGYLEFFTYSAPYMRVMRDLIAQRRSPMELMPLLASVYKKPTQ